MVALHVRVVLVVSAVRIIESQPISDVMGSPLPSTFQLTVTSVIYQPLLPDRPIIVGVMLGVRDGLYKARGPRKNL